MLLHVDRFIWAGSATSQGFGLCGFDQTLAMRSFDFCAVKVELRKKVLDIWCAGAAAFHSGWIWWAWLNKSKNKNKNQNNNNNTNTNTTNNNNNTSSSSNNNNNMRELFFWGLS
jgi:hypothetical protein